MYSARGSPQTETKGATSPPISPKVTTKEGKRGEPVWVGRGDYRQPSKCVFPGGSASKHTTQRKDRGPSRLHQKSRRDWDKIRKRYPDSWCGMLRPEKRSTKAPFTGPG